MKRTLLALALAGLLVPGVADAKKRHRGGDRAGDKDKPQHERALTMEKGTWQLEGSGTVDFSNQTGTTEFSLNLVPAAGYFVAERFEIRGAVGITYATDFAFQTVGAGVRYHFDVKPSWIYIGAGGYYLDQTGVALLVKPEAGFIYPLARNVGLDLGIKADVYIPDGGGDITYTGSLGYLGVQAYWR